MRHDHQLIPVMSVALRDPEKEGDEAYPVVESTANPIRKCDNCHLSAACPAYQAGHSCGYSIPVELKTKEQLQAMMQAIIEMQTQRVFQARFTEEIMGQELAVETGREMDRLMNLLSKAKEVSSSSDSLKVTVEGMGAFGSTAAGQASGGVLSSLFGPQMSAQRPSAAAEIVEGDVVE